MVRGTLPLPVVAALVLAPGPVTGQDERAAEETVIGFFDALEASDYDALREVVTDDFELVEDTMLMSTEEFVSFAKSFMEDGTTLTWELGEFKIEVRGPVAWTRYRNRGRMTTPEGENSPLEWLESAVLVKIDGQ